jgi:translation initiation factor IF-2
MRLYRVIYDAVEDIKKAMEGMLAPEFREKVMGNAEVREVFKIPSVGTIAGCYITEGKINRNDDVRIIRDGIVILEGKIASLRRFKDDVKEVNTGYECGIGIEKYNDLKVGDNIEAFTMEKIER